MKCNKCGSENPGSGKFCENCGAPMNGNGRGSTNYNTMNGLKKFGYDKTRALILAVINALLLVCFFALPWVKINSALASEWTGTSVSFSASALRLLILISRGTSAFEDYFGSDFVLSYTNVGYLKLGFIYLIIPILIVVCFVLLFFKNTSLNDFFRWSAITYIVTIAMVIIMMATKSIMFMYYNLDIYEGAVDLAFRSGAILSIVFSIVGLAVPKILPNFLEKDINMGNVKNRINGMKDSFDGAKSNFASKFEDEAGSRNSMPNNINSSATVQNRCNLEISLENNEIIIHNLSENGLAHLNGELLDSVNFYQLLDGDVIVCGDTTINVKLEQATSVEIVENQAGEEAQDQDMTVMLGIEIEA